MRITFTTDDSGAQRVLVRLQDAVGDMTPALQAIGDDIVAETQLRFRESRDPYGVGWLPLKPSTVAKRRKGSSQPLLDTGRLRNSIAARVDAASNSVVIGSNVAYAAIHQFGGDIRFGARSLKVRLRKVKINRADGTSYMATRFAKYAHKNAVEKWGTNASGWVVKIPARPYLPTAERNLPPAYRAIIRQRIKEHLKAAGGAT